MRLSLCLLGLAASAAIPVKQGFQALGVRKLDEASSSVQDATSLPINAMFSEAHSMMRGLPLNQCPNGMPENITILSTIGDGAIAKDRVGANAALDIWLKHAQGKACINGSVNRTLIDEPVTEDMSSSGGVLALPFHFNFERLAKVASNTIDAWMKCRFGIDPAPVAIASPAEGVQCHA